MPYPVFLPTRVLVDLSDTDQKFDMMWRIGHALVAPDGNGSVIVLYGRFGSEAKLRWWRC
jgi:hypothetical protein